jgi:hypothetical protein
MQRQSRSSQRRPRPFVSVLARLLGKRDDTPARLRRVRAGGEILQIACKRRDSIRLLRFGPGLVVGIFARAIGRRRLLRRQWGVRWLGATAQRQSHHGCENHRCQSAKSALSRPNSRAAEERHAAEQRNKVALPHRAGTKPNDHGEYSRSGPCVAAKAVRFQLLNASAIGHALIKVGSFVLHRSLCETCCRNTRHLRRKRLFC